LVGKAPCPAEAGLPPKGGLILEHYEASLKNRVLVPPCGIGGQIIKRVRGGWGKSSFGTSGRWGLITLVKKGTTEVKEQVNRKCREFIHI